MKNQVGSNGPSLHAARRVRFPWHVSLLLIALGAGLLWAWLAFTTPRLAQGWHYQVYARELDEVSALAFDEAGGLYATLEKRHGRGQLVLLGEGKVVTLLDGMDKPDGIARHGNAFYLTNESGERGLIEYRHGEVRDIDGVVGGEGIAAAGADRLLVVEDRKKAGRLLQVDAASGEIAVLLDGLNEAEGVCRGPDGDIYFVEKKASHLSRYRDGEVAVVLQGLDHPAFLNCLDDGAILVTEDRTNFGRLLRYRDGELEVLATRLHSPQSVIVGPDGALYLAEQRRNRILRISWSTR